MEKLKRELAEKKLKNAEDEEYNAALIEIDKRNRRASRARATQKNYSSKEDFTKARENINILLEELNLNLYNKIQLISKKPENGGIYYGDELIYTFIINEFNTQVNYQEMYDFLNDNKNITTINNYVDTLNENYNKLKKLVHINLTNEEITKHIIYFISKLSENERRFYVSEIFELLEQMGFKEVNIDFIKSKIQKVSQNTRNTRY